MGLAHADTYCIPAISLQLHGKKKWRLMPPPPIATILDRYKPHDAGIYGTGLWKPVYEDEVMPGEALVFFPNLFHETFLPEDGPDCTTAVTFQVQLPIPTRYLRAYLPTHALSHLQYEGHCENLWHSYATLRAPRGVTPSADAKKMKAHAAKLFKAADTNADGKFSVEEVEAYLAKETWPRWFLNDDYFYDFKPDNAERELVSNELLKNRAQDSVAYLDTDDDGFATREEVEAALVQWGVVNARLNRMEGFKEKRWKKAKIRKAIDEFDEKFGGGVGRLSSARADSAKHEL